MAGLKKSCWSTTKRTCARRWPNSLSPPRTSRCPKPAPAPRRSKRPEARSSTFVVLDVGPPDTDGRELCKRLRKQGEMPGGDADRA